MGASWIVDDPIKLAARVRTKTVELYGEDVSGDLTTPVSQAYWDSVRVESVVLANGDKGYVLNFSLKDGRHKRMVLPTDWARGISIKEEIIPLLLKRCVQLVLNAVSESA